MEVPFLHRYIQFGIIGGLAYAILSFVFYYFDPFLVANVYLKPIPLMAYLLMMLYAIQFKIANSTLKDIVYRDLVQAAFITFIFIELIADTYTYLLHNHIHQMLFPEGLSMEELIRQATIASETARYDQMGNVDLKDYEKMRAHLDAEDFSMNLSRISTGFFRWLIFGFGFSFLLAMFGMNRVKSLRHG